MHSIWCNDYSYLYVQVSIDVFYKNVWYLYEFEFPQYHNWLMYKVDLIVRFPPGIVSLFNLMQWKLKVVMKCYYFTFGCRINNKIIKVNVVNFL